MKYLIIIPLLFLSFNLGAQDAPQSPEANMKLENPGFEDGIKGWSLGTKDGGMSSVIADAAKKGKLGLRVVDKSLELGAGVISAHFPVKPGQKVKVECFARITEKTDKAFCSLNIVYFAKDKSWTTDSSEKLPGVPISDFSGKWKKYEVEAIVPDWVDSVAVWVHTWSNSVGTADFDDFDIKFK